MNRSGLALRGNHEAQVRCLRLLFSVDASWRNNVRHKNRERPAALLHPVIAVIESQKP